MELLVQLGIFLLEILAETILYFELLPWLWKWGSDETRAGCGYVPLFLLVGALLGGLMNLVHPRLLTPWESVRVAGLLLWPLTAGCFAWLVARAYRRRGVPVNLTVYFVSAFCLALGFDLVRYAFGVR